MEMRPVKAYKTNPVNKILTLALLIAGFTACNQGNKNTGENTPAQQTHDTNTIEFNHEQVQLAEIETGTIEKRILSDDVECTGFVEAPPQNLVSVTAPLGGFLRESYFFPGNHVEAGTILAVLEHPDYITLQQDYLQAQSELNYFKEEYKRMGELTLENATSVKKMQSARSDYQSLDARYMGLRKKLIFAGIDPDKLTADNISSSISLRAPISGYITRVEGNRGKYIPATEIIYQIVDKNHLHLVLQVFEKDIYRIKKDQLVNFHIPGVPGSFWKANVEAIGQMIDETNRTVMVHAHITGKTDQFMPGMYINARIILNNLPVFSLPVTSLVKMNDTDAVFIARGNKFTRVAVKKGIEQNDFVEILHPSQELRSSQIVIKGAYYLETELNKSTLQE